MASTSRDKRPSGPLWRKRLPPTRAYAFAWFEAFDAPWKPAHALEAPPEKRAREAHFGLFRADGSAKPAVSTVR